MPSPRECSSISSPARSAWSTFERQVGTAPIRDMTNRWRKDLSPAQQALLTDLLRDDLRRYGYETE